MRCVALRGQQVERWEGRKLSVDMHHDEAQKVRLHVPFLFWKTKLSLDSLQFQGPSESEIATAGETPKDWHGQQIQKHTSKWKEGTVARHDTWWDCLLKPKHFTKIGWCRKSCSMHFEVTGILIMVTNPTLRQASMCPKDFPAYCLAPLCQALQEIKWKT